MLPKQTNYSVGVYMRLSKDDERNGESLSIENQRKMLTDYVSEQGWTIYDEYVDDGISGVTFDEHPNGNMANAQSLIRSITFLCSNFYKPVPIHLFTDKQKPPHELRRFLFVHYIGIKPYILSYCADRESF